MNKLTALIQSGMALLCLLLTLPCAPLTAQTELCPPYPRAMDQAFVCIAVQDNKIWLKLDPKAGLHNPVRFVFPSFTPDPAITVTTLNVDFGDGMGSRTITSGSTYTITYPTPGQYTLTYNGFVLGGSGNRPLAGSMVFQSNQNPTFTYPVANADETWGDVTSNAFTPPAGNYYPAGSPYNQPVTAGGLVHIRYANPDKQLRKPFILVEGFDPVLDQDKYKVVDAAGQPLGYGSLRWDVVVTGRNESFDEDPNEAGVPHTPQFALLPILVDAIISKGYDLVYVDLADGATYMQANGDFLIKVIERVNSEKITSEENVLLGGSMGGILGRYALAKMEQEGKSHCTGLLFTLDSPHNGANIPLSVQAFGWFFHAIGEEEDAWTALNTPAARQMLITNLGTEIANGSVWFNNLFGPYATPLSFDELTQYDYSGMRGQWLSALGQVGWPKMPRKVALLDGMKDGTALSNQGFGPSSEFFDVAIMRITPATPVKGFNLSMRSNGGGGTESQDVFAFDECEPYPAVVEPTTNYLFTAAVPHDKNNCAGLSLPYLYHSVSLETNGSLPYLDNAPGSCRLDLRTVRALLKEIAEEDGNTFVSSPYFPRLTFVPTWSSLAMATPLENQSLFVDLTAQTFFPENLPNAQVPNFDNFYAPPTNLRHVELDGGMQTFILAELDALAAAPQAGTLAEEYNYGLRYKLIPNTTVASTGKMNINNPGATGYVQSAPGGAAVKPLFTTYLSECGQSITVESGGQYNIGALDKSQHGITEVWDGATVHIKAGGTLRITSDQSMLWIKEGAQLILDPGAIVNLEALTSHIRIEGTLLVNGNFTFQGRGHFDFWNDHGLLLGPLANAFRVHAQPINTRSIRLSHNTRLHIPAGKGIDLNWGGVEYTQDNMLLLGQGSWAEARHAHFTGYNEKAVGISGENPGRLVIEDSFFDGVDAPIDISGSNNFNTDLTTVKRTRFEHYENGSRIAERNKVLFDHCTLLGTGFGAYYGVFSDRNKVFILRESSISDHNGSFTYDTDGLLATTEARTGARVNGGLVFWMDGGNIHNCDIGIGNHESVDDIPTNVWLNHFATISNCQGGIVMDGDATKGLVLMDCARLLNNDWGILGEDIRLMIDPTVIAKQNGTPVSPNTFTLASSNSNINKYFKICYRQFPSPGQPIPARMNYWGKVLGGVTTQHLTPRTDIDLKRPQGATACSANVTMDVSGAITRPPSGCDIEEFCDPNANCVDDCATLLELMRVENQ